MHEIGKDVAEPALARQRVRWKGWTILWVGFLVVELVLLLGNGALDTWLWCATRWVVGDRDFYKWVSYRAGHVGEIGGPFYMREEPPMGSGLYGETKYVWEVLKAFGEPWMVVMVAVVVACCQWPKWVRGVVSVVAGASLAGGIGALVRIVAGRVRPTHIDGGNQWVFLRGFYDGKDLSWPSGHATVAFALAGVLSVLCPKGRWVFVAVACGCAWSRVVMGAHFYSDAAWGGVLGWTVGWWVARWVGERLFVDKNAVESGSGSV